MRSCRASSCALFGLAAVASVVGARRAGPVVPFLTGTGSSRRWFAIKRSFQLIGLVAVSHRIAEQFQESRWQPSEELVFAPPNRSDGSN
jgi:hypothetical protein